jgi:hypothetical protein
MVSATWKLFAYGAADADDAGRPLGRRFRGEDGSEFAWNPDLGDGIDRFDAAGDYVETITLATLRTIDPSLAQRMGAYYIDNITAALLAGATTGLH